MTFMIKTHLLDVVSKVRSPPLLDNNMISSYMNSIPLRAILCFGIKEVEARPYETFRFNRRASASHTLDRDAELSTGRRILRQ